ncbi:MAG: hypothetical protein IJ633_07425 [Prevotella sp.]|nr:hypothetical protein [Prevotella sp.]
MTTASVTMTVNGEEKQYNLLGENQDPIDLGTIYKKEVTGAHGDQWTLPDLGFESFIVESAVPYTQSEAAGVYGASMTFTTLPKSEADQIGEGFAVDNNDYKTGNFGQFPAILCGTEEGLAKLSEDWAYIASPMDVWVNWMSSMLTVQPTLLGTLSMDNVWSSLLRRVCMSRTERKSSSDNVNLLHSHKLFCQK